MAKAPKVKNPNRVGVGRLLAWKSSDISAAGVLYITLNYLTIYCTDTLGLNPAILGTILMASKIIDAVVDIFYAWLVDNTNTKWGRGRPYELSILGMTLCTILLFSASPAWSTVMKYVWVGSVYVMVFAVFQSLRATAMNAYQIRAFSNNSALLTKVSSYGGVITMVGSMLVSTTFPMVMAKLATSSGGWTTTLAIYMIPLTLIGVLRFIFVKEDTTVDAGKAYEKINVKDIFQMFAKNPYVWVYAGMLLAFNISTSLGGASYYFKWVVGNEGLAGIVSIFSFILVPLMLVFPVIAKKIGSIGKMVAIFCLVGAIGYVIVFVGGSLPTTFGGMMIAGMATLPMSYYGILFVQRCATYNTMLGMQTMECSSNAIANFSANFGGALGSFISGILLSLGQYNYGEGVVSQPESAVGMIKVIYSVVPAVLVLVCAFCAWKFFGLEKKIAQWEAKKAESAEQA